jgi:site-specific DNA-methyltransferase (adenine-specific)
LTNGQWYGKVVHIGYKQIGSNMQNTFYHGDCKFVMEHDIEPNSIDLIYLDPPFFTGKVQKGTAKWNPAEMEVSYEDSKKFWGESAKVKAMRENAPEWLQHIALQRPDFASYLFYMMERLKLCHRVLKDTGSIYLHCDYRASHYLKMIMDEPKLFGYDNFRNEIVWCYSGGGIPTKDYPRKHDIILRYTKGDNYAFKVEYKPYKENTQQVGKHSTYSAGDININLDRGTPVTDWWVDIKTATGWANEKVGYPTQKPLELLKRIIRASSKEGDVILDPFCGCGTAIIAAQQLNRKWIGIDISKSAYEVSSVRQGELPLDFTHFDYITRDIKEINTLNPNQFEKWVNEYYKAEKPKTDKGVDGIMPDGTPIQTKAYLVKYPLVAEFADNMKRHPKVPQPVKKAIMVSQVGFDDSAKKRQFEIKTTDNIDIQFTTPRQLLNCEDKLWN